MKVFTVTDPVFKTEPLFVIGCTHADLGRYLKQRFHVTVGDDAGQCGQMLTFSKAPWRVVWSRERCIGTLLHEVFHLTTRICHDKGVPIRAITGDDENGDETAAYLYEFFVTSALRKVRKWRNG